MKRFKSPLFALLAAAIWGTAFSMQSIAAEYLSPFSLNAIRAGIAAVVLFIVCLFRKNVRLGSLRDLVLGGLVCGTALFLATNVQQLGIEGTSAGKAGFITALYIVLVPVAGIFLRKKLPARVWIAVAIAVVGLYFLCIREDFSLNRYDGYVLICAFLFAAQILSIDFFVQRVDAIALSCAEFIVTAVFSAVGALLTEQPTVQDFIACLWPMLYIALFSSCIAYTLQIVAQKDGNPTVVSLLLGAESVFAALGGALILHQHLSLRELFGCGLMLCAIVLAILPGRKKAE